MAGAGWQGAGCHASVAGFGGGVLVPVTGLIRPVRPKEMANAFDTNAFQPEFFRRVPIALRAFMGLLALASLLQRPR